jgi:hypothetical protein
MRACRQVTFAEALLTADLCTIPQEMVFNVVATIVVIHMRQLLKCFAVIVVIPLQCTLCCRRRPKAPFLCEGSFPVNGYKTYHGRNRH